MIVTIRCNMLWIRSIFVLHDKSRYKLKFYYERNNLLLWHSLRFNNWYFLRMFDISSSFDFHFLFDLYTVIISYVEIYSSLKRNRLHCDDKSKLLANDQSIQRTTSWRCTWLTSSVATGANISRNYDDTKRLRHFFNKVNDY